MEVDVAETAEDRDVFDPAGIRFSFDERKAAAAAGHLLQLANGRMPYMKLIKLMYVAERESLREYKRPITGDTYVAMKLGPVLSETLRLIKRQCPSDGPWEQTVGRDDYDARLLATPDEGPLSTAELELLDRVWRLYSTLDQFDLSRLSHQAFPEWTDPGDSAKEITPEEILRAVGKTDEEIEETWQDAVEDNYFNRIFGR
jgi:uncharacterized phage-associated protein